MVADLARLRGELVDMLLDDRRRALQAKNPSAAIAASGKIVDLILGKFAEDVPTATPITKIEQVIVHQVICPVCKERLPVSATPPAEPKEVKPRRASGWDSEPEPEPAALEPPPGLSLGTIQVPKLPRTDRRRDRDNPLISGLV